MTFAVQNTKHVIDNNLKTRYLTGSPSTHGISQHQCVILGIGSHVSNGFVLGYLEPLFCLLD